MSAPLPQHRTISEISKRGRVTGLKAHREDRSGEIDTTLAENAGPQADL
jgi:hypothetical protein